MKNKTLLFRRSNFSMGFIKICASLVFLLSFSVLASASDGTWLSATGNGDWSDSTKWESGNIASGTDATATFDGATGNVITLTGPESIGNISVTNWTGTTWTIAGDTLTLDTSGASSVINIVGSGATSLEITALLAGTSGFTLTGSGRLYLSNSGNTFTGGITVNDGILYSANAGALNGNTIRMGHGMTWLIDGNNQDYTNDVVAVGNSIWLSVSGNNVSNILSGVISETEGSPHTLNLSTNGGNTVTVLQGANTYTGNTVIGASHDYGYAVVRAENDQAFGTGIADIEFRIDSKTHDNDAVELAGDVTISDKTLTLRGTGREDAGSLRSVEGDNVWNGDIDTGDFGNATIGVDADTLTIRGVIRGTGDNGLTKVGSGTLILNGENTYSHGTDIREGVILAGHADAFAGGDVSLSDAATLAIAAGVTLNVDNFTLEGSLVFHLDDQFDITKIQVTGDQIGTETYMVQIMNEGMLEGTYTLMEIAGSYQATGFELTSPNSSYSLDWNAGTLSLIVVPEPNVALLLLFGTAAFMLRRRRS